MDFHDDYKGMVFDIESGCILASGKTAKVEISKDIDELANTPSVFSVVRNVDETCQQMLVDHAGRKIVIKLPLRDYYSYKQLSRIPQTQELLNSLTVVPALTYVLEELQKLSKQEREEYEDNLWYRTLSRTLSKQFDCDIESDAFDSKNCIELAQKLINNPVSDAFNTLTSSFGFSGGDEE